MAFSASRSVLRSPRAWANVSGARLDLLECSVNVTLHQSADTFYAKLPLDNPAGLDEGYWSDTAPIPLSITAVNDLASDVPTELISGVIDQAQIDFGRRVVEIRGRDRTAKLADQKINAQFTNQTNRQTIETVAAQAGLTVQFSGDTDRAGLSYGDDQANYVEIADLDSAWNVIVACANRLGCIAFIKGTTLYIQPIDQAPSSVIEFSYQRPTAQQIESANCVWLLCTRNLNLSKEVSVQVQSWQHKQGETVTTEYKSVGKSSEKLLYQFRAANLTKAQQDRIARNHLRQTLTHEREVTVANMAGDVTVSPLQGFRLKGTQTAFDQDYILSIVTHRFQFKSGYLMDVTAHSQDAKRGAPQQVK